MSRKYFCDECGKELSAEELQYSLEMTGKELCSEHSYKKVFGGGNKSWTKANGKRYAKTHDGWVYPID